jgi:hypothetical protein
VIVTLVSDCTSAVIDTDRGAEVRSLSVNRIPVLFSKSGPKEIFDAEEVDEEQWASGFGGGWQLLTPNAGNRSILAGHDFGYHGAASRARWELESGVPSTSTARVHLTRQGVAVARTFQAMNDGIRVDTVWNATADQAAAIAVEHCILGEQLVPENLSNLRLSVVPIAGAQAIVRELSEDPTVDPGAWLPWPWAGRVGGGIDRLDTPRERNRLYAVSGLQALEVVGGAARCRIEFGGVYRSAWIWIPEAAGRLGVEPASIPHHLGLSEAVAKRESMFGPDHRDAHGWVRLQVLP